MKRVIEDLYLYHLEVAKTKAKNALDLQFRLNKVEQLYWISVNAQYTPDYLKVIGWKH